ncbi:MAG: DUF167 domain-containing protein [Acidobacteria bacterium]|nr:DUF167 domain-containing protein [Acidobacteriota bacterium]
MGARRPSPDPSGAAGRSSLQLADIAGGTVLGVRVIPRAGHTAITGVRDGALLVRLAAAPVEGAANAALLELLAAHLRVPIRSLSLLSGGRSRAKRVRIAGLGRADVATRLL